MKVSIKEVCAYVANKPEKAFTSFVDAEAAYAKHLQRRENRDFVDPLREFFRAYHIKYRRFFNSRDIEYSWYDFKEIKEFLKKNGYWGTQVFNSHATEPTDCIYNKDWVQICTNDYYGYIDVVGLKECDFYVIHKAYESIYDRLWKDED